MRNLRPLIIIGLLCLAWSLATPAEAASGKAHAQVLRRIGPSDAVMLADPDGRVIVAKNIDLPLVPASILKIFTALVVLDSLGVDFQYTTEFYRDNLGDLTIKGYGDPLLISEVVADISERLAGVISDQAPFNNLRLDESYFVKPLTIPGVSATSQPYDAPNGALCVNFNTVNFKRFKNRYVSAEPQTPLIPFALDRIKQNRATRGRVVLSRIENENTLYAGELFRYFLEKEGIRFNGTVKIGRTRSADRLILTYRSPYRLTDIIAKMLEHSNNFITNQLLITAGISTQLAPGSLDKGVRSARRYAADRLGLKNLDIVEGSGISRRNRISARQMMAVLKQFEPHHRLMRQDLNEFYKTGTLKGVSTRAGYLLNSEGLQYPFVIMFNSPGKTAPPLMPYLKKIVQQFEYK